VLTWYAGVVDLHVNGVSTAAHQVRVTDVNRAMVATTALDPAGQIGQLDTVSGRRTIPASRVRRRDPVEGLDDSDQLWAAVWPGRTPQSKSRYAWYVKTLTADIHDRGGV